MTVHRLQEARLDLADAVFCGDGTAHGRDLGSPLGKEFCAAAIILCIARQNVHMQMVVTDMPPGGRFKPTFRQRAAIEGDNIGQVRVGHRHVRTQFGDGGIHAAALVDEHVDALGHRMAEESLTLAIDLGARDPCRIVTAARKLQYPPQVIQLLSRLGFVVAVELHVDTDLGVFVERRQRGKRRRLLALAT